jgi:membrane-associated protease RseP (regulator of RpoE activity)
MAYALGVILFAVGILVSVCLHEAGHMVTAKAFGMKVTRYFVGFGPTLWSFRRGETEYGVKAIPAGGFVKIVGMTPLEDDVDDADQPRAFWRQPVWKRTIVLSAGSLTHFVLGFALLLIAAVFVGLPNPTPLSDVKPTISQVSACVVPGWELGPRGDLRGCRPGDPVSPARAAGLRAGDTLVAVGATRVANYGEAQRAIRSAPAGPTRITFVRDGREHTVTADLVATHRPPLGVSAPTAGTRTETVSALGFSPQLPPATVRYGPAEGLSQSVRSTGQLFTGTFAAIGKFPEKVPKLFHALRGQQRDPETPISVVGASRIGGEALSAPGPGGATIFLLVLASLNVFIGIFNLFPLLPLDGGHIAIVWFERVRSWIAVRLGRPDPGRVDYNKLMPITYAVVLVFGAISILTIVTDIVNPVRLFQ